MDGVYSVYNTRPVAESGHSSDNPGHYDTLIYDASPIPPSESPTPEAPHTPLLTPRSRISDPSSDVGLGRACNAALSQSPSSCVNGPGKLDGHTEVRVVTRGELSWLECRESREGQEEGEDPGPGLGEGSSGPSGDLGPSPLPPPNDRKEVMRCWRKSTLAIKCKTPPTLHNTNFDNLSPLLLAPLPRPPPPLLEGINPRSVSLFPQLSTQPVEAHSTGGRYLYEPPSTSGSDHCAGQQQSTWDTWEGQPNAPWPTKKNKGYG